MNNKSLKLISGHMIMESKLSKNSKIQTLNFIKEANTHQIMGLLLDGEMYFNLTKEEKRLLEKRFKNSKVYRKINENLLEFDPAKAVSAAANIGKDIVTKAGNALSNIGMRDVEAATILSILTGMTIITLYFGPKVFRGLMSELSGTITSCGRKCAKLEGNQRHVCIQKCKAIGLEKKISKLKSMVAKCKNAKNPEKCTKKIKSMIDSTEKKLRKVNDKIRMMS